MKEKIKNLFKDKKFIFGIVIWFVVAIYLVSCIIFTAKNVYAFDMVSSGEWVAEDKTITLDNGQEIPLYKDGQYTDYPYVYIRFNSYLNDYDVIYTKEKITMKQSLSETSKKEITHITYSVVNETYSKSTGYIYIRGGSSNRYSSVFCNYDIIIEDNGEVFFREAPTTPVIYQTELSGAKIVKKTLAVIGSLIPLLIVSVIGFLAFRKGWKFLVTNLKRA